VPKCFRSVKCPYPQAQTVNGGYGAINYSLIGPAGGELVVCLHGLNGSRVLFQDTAEHISKHGGFRVLSYDLYGHGLSNAPRVDLCPCRGCGSCCELASCGSFRARYDMDFFVDQADDLLSVLGLGDEPINLLGFSLGGAIAVAFAQRFPSRVRRLVAMSPAGFLPKVPMAYYLLKALWCCVIPLAPHVLCTCWYKRERFAKSLRSDGQEVDNEIVESLWSRFVWQLYVKRGVASATLAVCHRIPWFGLKPVFKDAGRSKRPVLLVWGEKDSLNPQATVAKEVESCFTNVKLLVVPGAGHIAICDRPRQVILSILQFLKLPPDVRMDTVEFRVPAPVPRVGSTSSSSATSHSGGLQQVAATGAGADRGGGAGGAGASAGASVGGAGADAGGAAAQPGQSSSSAALASDEVVAEVGATSQQQQQQQPGNWSRPQGGRRAAASAAQMPVPMVLGHVEEINDDDDEIGDDVETPLQQKEGDATHGGGSRRGRGSGASGDRQLHPVGPGGTMHRL